MQRTRLMAFTLVKFADAAPLVRARDLRTIKKTEGHPDYQWAVLRAARGRETKPRVVAVLMHDDGYRRTSVIGRPQLGFLELLRLLQSSDGMFDWEEQCYDFHPLLVDCDPIFHRTSHVPKGPTAALLAYVCDGGSTTTLNFRTGPVEIGKRSAHLVLLRPQLGRICPSWWWNIGGSSLVVTARLVHRGDKDQSPTHPGAMRTVMTTRTLEDGTFVVGFWPPVGCWLERDSDVELRVWYRRPDGIFVDLLVEWQKDKEEVRVRKSDDPRGIYYPRLCKLWYHSPRQSFILDAHHVPGALPPNVDHELYFYTVAQLSVLPTWPPRQYRDEGDQLLLLGGAHEVARRHDEEVRRCAAARRIQSVWREASACPERAVCRRRLLREFDDMTDVA